MKQYFKIVKTSEWDARAIISYALIHHNKQLKAKLKSLSNYKEDKVDSFLIGKNISLDSKKPAKKITSKNLDFKKILMAAIQVNNDHPDIKRVKGSDLKGIDLLFYSFPCQGLSIANMGRGKGISVDSDSTSALVWEIYRILEEAKNHLPKYLVMENVVQLNRKRHKKDFKKWLKFLSESGYKTFIAELDATKFGSIQKRVRLFAISILGYQKSEHDDFAKNDITKHLITKYGRELDRPARRNKYLKFFTQSSSDQEKLKSVPNDTPSRIRMKKNNPKLLESKSFYVRTITTKQDRHPNTGMIELPEKLKVKGKLGARFITPREAYLCMGFKNKDFDKLKPYIEKNILNYTSLYRQAGNSIVVEVLRGIFKFILAIERGDYAL